MEDSCTWQSFIPKWSIEPYVPGGVYLPEEDEGQRKASARLPQGVIDVLATTKGAANLQNQHSKPAKPYLSEFSAFTRLPPEIRQMIWRYTLPGPRVLELFYDTATGACTTSCQPPTALHICEESRMIAMKHYQLCFSTKLVPATAYVDFNIDEIYLGVGNLSPDRQATIELIHSLKSEDVSRIQDLAIHDLVIYDYGKDWEDREYWELLDSANDPNCSLNHLLTSLRSLTFVTNPSQGHTGHYSKFSHFHSDIVLAEVEENPGEFQAWSLSSAWSLSPDGDARPWKLPLGEATWERHVSEIWAYLEYRKRETEDFPIKKVRWVTLEQLSKQVKWADRSQYCERNKKYMEPFVLELLKVMEEETGQYLGNTTLDPIDVYLSTSICSCAVGHAQHAEGLLEFSTEELAILDLEGRVKKLCSLTDDMEGD